MKRLVPWLLILVVIGGAIWGSIYMFGTTADPNQKPDIAGIGVNGSGDNDNEIPVADPPGATPGIPADIFHDPVDDPGPVETVETAADIYDKAISGEDENGLAAVVPLYEKVMDMEPGGTAAAKAAAKLAPYYAGINEEVKALACYQDALMSMHWRDADRALLMAGMAALSEDDPINVAGEEPLTKFYKIRRGDSLSKIAAKYKLTVGYLKKINGLTRDLIRVDDELKVADGPFDAMVDKSDLTLTIMHKGRAVKQYSVGLGKEDRTPVGSFHVTTKLIDPDWYTREGVIPSGDPENILGTRWVGFTGSFGIHGTTEPDSIGKYSSNGCVRMLNADAEEVYAYLRRKSSKVTIRE